MAAPAHCPCCGSDRLSKLGEDLTETLEVVPRRWKVVQTVRERFACRACETVTQPPAPSYVTPRGLLGPHFLAQFLFEKFSQHQPLNRQTERYAREGVDISLSTLADQVGACTAALAPLHRFIAGHVLGAGRLHGDDTTVPVLAKGKTDTGRLWTYVRDDRPHGGRRHRQPCSTIRATDAPNIRPGIWKDMQASCRPTPMPATMRCSGASGCLHPYSGRCAGRTHAASSSNWPMSPARCGAGVVARSSRPLRSRQCGGSTRYSTSSAPSSASLRPSGRPRARN